MTPPVEVPLPREVEQQRAQHERTARRAEIRRSSKRKAKRAA